MERLKKYGALILKIGILAVAVIILYRVANDSAIKAECSQKAQDITRDRVRSDAFNKHISGEYYPQVHEILKGAYEDCLIQAGIL